jgi:amino acid transporter
MSFCGVILTEYSVCLSIAAFAYIGVEITAATALEARLDKKPRSGEEAASHATKGPWPAVSVQFSATWTSFIAWVIYFLGSLMMTLNVKWDDINLPRAGWLGSPGKDEGTLNTDSGFVISAARSHIPGLEDMFTVVLLITALTAANTNLYVASRTLFGLTRKLHGHRWSWLAFFGRTNNYQVPVRAMFISCFFLWIPFLYLSPDNSPDTTIPSVKNPMLRFVLWYLLTEWFNIAPRSFITARLRQLSDCMDVRMLGVPSLLSLVSDASAEAQCRKRDSPWLV